VFSTIYDDVIHPQLSGDSMEGSKRHSVELNSTQGKTGLTQE
jgi:hypothetical protein